MNKQNGTSLITVMIVMLLIAYLAAKIELYLNENLKDNYNFYKAVLNEKPATPNILYSDITDISYNSYILRINNFFLLDFNSYFYNINLCKNKYYNFSIKMGSAYSCKVSTANKNSAYYENIETDSLYINSLNLISVSSLGYINISSINTNTDLILIAAENIKIKNILNSSNLSLNVTLISAKGEVSIDQLSNNINLKIIAWDNINAATVTNNTDNQIALNVKMAEVISMMNK